MIITWLYIDNRNTKGYVNDHDNEHAHGYDNASADFI